MASQATVGGRVSRAAVASSVVATAVTLLILDLTWLGVVASSLYDRLGPLKRPSVFWPAAILFYAFYVAAIVLHAVRGARGGPVDAARRGAGMGLLAYATYELTNWAVLRDWPAVLVPIDIAWGVVLTAAAAWAGCLAHDAVGRR